jgi:hypothetical protein
VAHPFSSPSVTSSEMAGVLSFLLTLLLIGTIGAAQTDNPTFWLLIGPAPFSVSLEILRKTSL